MFYVWFGIFMLFLGLYFRDQPNSSAREGWWLGPVIFILCIWAYFDNLP